MEQYTTFKLYLLLFGVFLFSCKLSCWMYTSNHIIQVRLASCAQSRHLMNASCEEISAELVLFSLFFLPDQFMKLLNQDLAVSLIIHPHDHLLPRYLLYLATSVMLLKVLNRLIQTLLTLEWSLLSVHCFQDGLKAAPYMQLYVSELFITLIFQHFTEQCHLMILPTVSSNRINYRCAPLNDQWFDAVFLYQVSIQELLHSLHRQSTLPWFRIKLKLLRIDIGY